MLWSLIKTTEIMSLTPTTSEGKSFAMPPTKCTLMLLPSGSDSSKEANSYSAIESCIIPVIVNSIWLSTLFKYTGGDIIVPCIK